MTGAETPVRYTTMVTMCRTKHMDGATTRAVEAMVLHAAQAAAQAIPYIDVTTIDSAAPQVVRATRHHPAGDSGPGTLTGTKGLAP